MVFQFVEVGILYLSKNALVINKALGFGNIATKVLLSAKCWGELGDGRKVRAMSYEVQINQNETKLLRFAMDCTAFSL
jgi:hypothetical protein